MSKGSGITVIGSIAIDDIGTPHGDYKNVFGGSATHFACAARFFAPVSMVGCVGRDMPQEFWLSLENAGIDLSAVKRLDGTTFRWGGKYNDDMSVADTYFLDFGVMADFQPELPGDKADARYVFLANAAPAVQMRMLDQLRTDAFVVCDTIRHYIENNGDEFLKVIGRCTGVILNDEEIRLLTGEKGLIDGAKTVLESGPEFVVVKKGEHGAILMSREDTFPMPGYPVKEVKDPTGAGDSFAGGFMGTICGLGSADRTSLKKALAAGIVISSFNVEGVGPEATLKATRDDVTSRLDEYRDLLTI